MEAAKRCGTFLNFFGMFPTYHLPDLCRQRARVGLVVLQRFSRGSKLAFGAIHLLRIYGNNILQGIRTLLSHLLLRFFDLV